MTLQFDGLGREALDAYSRRAGRAAPDVARTATLYYLADRSVDRLARGVPRFMRALDRGRGQALEVECDDEAFDSLHREAGRQGIATERLAEHALMYFLADYDAGRIANGPGAAMGEEV
jgi:hypothetical protein